MREAPPKGYWIECGSDWDAKDVLIACGKTDHSLCGDLTLYRTTGSLKGMKYIHHGWGTGWVPLTWTCFPWRELKAGRLQHFETLEDLRVALGMHSRAGFIEIEVL